MVTVRRVAAALALGVGLFAVGLAITSANGAPAGGYSTVPVALGDDGSAAVVAQLREMTGASCSETASILYAEELLYSDVDAFVPAAGWLPDGLAYVGDLQNAADSIAGTLRSQTAQSGTIEVVAGDSAKVLRMAQHTTPKNRSFWVVAGVERLSGEGCER